MKKDPWIRYGKATGITLVGYIAYSMVGHNNLGGGHVGGMATFVFVAMLILIPVINLLYALLGKWFNEIRYCLPRFLIMLFVLDAEDKPAELIDLSNPMVG